MRIFLFSEKIVFKVFCLVYKGENCGAKASSLMRMLAEIRSLGSGAKHFKKRLTRLASLLQLLALITSPRQLSL